MAAVAAAVALLPLTGSAHPASVLLPKESLAEKIDAHSCVVLARPTRLEEPEYRVTAVLKSGGGVSRGDIVQASLSRDAEAPESIDNLLTSLLITRQSAEGEWVVQSPAGLHLTPFFRKVIALPEGFADSEVLYRERLRFFLPLLAHPDTRIATSAVAAIGRAPYLTVRGLKEDLDRERIRTWIDDPKQAGWRSLQFTLLGIGGNSEDAEFVRERIEEMREANEHKNLAALLVCYIEMGGVEAAGYIVDAYVKNRDRTFGEIGSALTALAMQGDERDPLPREKAIEAFDWLLENRQPLTYLVVPDYLRWEHWEVMPELADIARRQRDSVPFVRKRVVAYLQACPLPEARKHLAELEAPN